ncbi:MAG: cupin domain-containing protein [Deltaproteobacteria bacterium]|nr:cupin domain-containing protein [Deltaproteobacteria bacterium]
MEERWPWEDEKSAAIDPHAQQCAEEAFKNKLPHVIKPLAVQGTVMGKSSPHQTGDIVCYDYLKRAPLYDLTGHFSDIKPKAPVRGAHRHISAPTLFCVSGRGWEGNDGKIYWFNTYDMLVVPPFTIHQHGGDEQIGAEIFVPQSRMFSLLGLTKREQIKFGEKPTFSQNTEPLYDDEKKLIGYRIKKGVLGIKEDIDVMLGADQETEAVFQGRKNAEPWQGPVANTYDRYLKMFQDEGCFCNDLTHVVAFEDQPWEWSRQGKLKWFTHPEMNSAARRLWLYMQEIAAGTRSGKHRHMMEEQILVLRGRGHDVHDGQRWNWERGDLINIPAMTEHQHFNDDDRDPALFLVSMPSVSADLGLGGIVQIEDAPDYADHSGSE